MLILSLNNILLRLYNQTTTLNMTEISKYEKYPEL